MTNTNPIKKLLLLLKNGMDIHNALATVQVRSTTKDFILTTFSFFRLEIHELAAAFVYGREGITTAMFLPLLEQLEKKIRNHNKNQLSTLIYYFKRHIALDNGSHYPKAIRMLANLIRDDKNKLESVEKVAIKALTSRINFLTGIQQSFSEYCGVNKLYTS